MDVSPNHEIDRDLARRFQALSDVKRLRILALLRAGERCVCELMESVGVPQPLLSFHLRILREAGLVTDRREGRWVHYAIAPEALADLTAFLESMASRRRRASGVLTTSG
jgi:ArsR family transcriptional regulator